LLAYYDAYAAELAVYPKSSLLGEEKVNLFDPICQKQRFDHVCYLFELIRTKTNKHLQSIQTLFNVVLQGFLQGPDSKLTVKLQY